ncbi:MAG TPA: hypothetical protein VM553_10400, partial [Dongiaceae bacterium]|nr:hypothetical protein [Dongiaceae bacterium]
WQIDGVAGSTTTSCAVNEVSTDLQGHTKSRITLLDHSGKVDDRIEIKDYVSGDFIVEDRDVIQVGIAGGNDGTVTEVLLTKHRRN